MNMSTDEAVGKGLHRIHQQVTADRLHNVFHEFWTVAFQTLPLLGGADTLVGDGIAAEFVLPDAWLYVTEFSAGWKVDEHHPASPRELDAMCLCGGVHGIV